MITAVVIIASVALIILIAAAVGAHEDMYGFDDSNNTHGDDK